MTVTIFLHVENFNPGINIILPTSEAIVIFSPLEM